MQTIEIIMVIFASVISLMALVMLFTSIRKKKEGELGYFQEVIVGPDGKPYIKFSSTTFFSFMFMLFLFMGNLIFLTEIASSQGDTDWQFSVTFLIFNVIFVLGVFAPKQLKNMDYNKLISMIKP